MKANLKIYSTLLLAVFILVGCQKEEVGPNGVTSSYYFTGKFGLSTEAIQAGKDKYGMAFGVIDEVEGDDVSYDFTFSLIRGDGDEANRSIALNFHNYYTGPEKVSKEDFQAIFATGTRDFWQGGDDAGVEIVWWDDNGVTWSSKSGNENGALFTIIEEEPVGSIMVDHKIKATVNCELFDINGNSMTLTDAEVSARFGKP